MILWGENHYQIVKLGICLSSAEEFLHFFAYGRLTPVGVRVGRKVKLASVLEPFIKPLARCLECDFPVFCLRSFLELIFSQLIEPIAFPTSQQLKYDNWASHPCLLVMVMLPLCMCASRITVGPSTLDRAASPALRCFLLSSFLSHCREMV
jgi:hypothetical protein